MNPNYNSKISPLIDVNNVKQSKKKYMDITWKEYLEARFMGGNFSGEKSERRKSLNDYMIPDDDKKEL